MKQKIKLEFLSQSINEGFARSTALAFLSRMNPNLDELNDVKTAISEAVTNCIVHGYEGKEDGIISMTVEIKGNITSIEIEDNGVGIENIEKAKEPFFTTKNKDERSGMGFTVMESFMDELEVSSKKHGGTKVKLTKKFSINETLKNDENEVLMFKKKA